MATNPSYDYPTPAQPLACWNCHQPLRTGAVYCPHCRWRVDEVRSVPERIARQPVIEEGQPVSPAWVAPATPTPVRPDSKSRPLAGRFVAAPTLAQRKPSDATSNLMGKLRKEQEEGIGFFVQSGPLEKTIQLRAVPKPAPAPAQAPEAVPLPAWLQPATTGKHPAVVMEPDGSWLLSSGHSIPLVKPPTPPAEIYPPFPDGKVACTPCNGTGRNYLQPNAAAHAFICQSCGGKGRVEPAIPQPLPAADVTGPTAAALEAVKAEPVVTLELPETAEARKQEAARLARIMARRQQVASIKRWVFESLTTMQQQRAKVEVWRDALEELVLAAQGEQQDESLETLQRVGKGITTILQHLQGSLMYADFTHGWLGEAIQADDKLLGPMVKQEGESNG